MPLGGALVKAAATHWPAAAAVGAPLPAHPGSRHLALRARAPSSVSAPLPAGKPPPAARAHRPAAPARARAAGVRRPGAPRPRSVASRAWWGPAVRLPL